MNQKKYESYIKILKEELVPAMGCTEPIAIAYAAAKARDILGEIPEKAEINVSGNIIKNVKSVIVPNTGGMRGIEAAVAAGIAAGKAEKKLEVLSEVTVKEIAQIKEYKDHVVIDVKPSDSGCVFDILLSVSSKEHNAIVQIQGYHTNIVKIEKDGKILYQSFYKEDGEKADDRENLNIEEIIEFADNVSIEDIQDTIETQIAYNTAIAKEGLAGVWGAGIGKILMQYGEGVRNRAKAMAAAGSDARMNGCDMPVVINSGSGNQGLTTSLPVIVYAEELKVSREMLLRALVVSNLVTIHLKSGIGRLSAYCGAISAGCGAAAGIIYLYGGKYKEVAHTIVNALAINSGVICDGAKSSCAAKIASAVEAGLLGMEMFRSGSQFYDGDGIVVKGVENTIQNISELAREGMCETDKTIIKIMTEKKKK